MFFFSDLIGLYGNQTQSVSTNLNGAKKRAVELVVAEMGMFLAGIPDREIDAVFAEQTPAPSLNQPQKTWR